MAAWAAWAAVIVGLLIGVATVIVSWLNVRAGQAAVEAQLAASARNIRAERKRQLYQDILTELSVRAERPGEDDVRVWQVRLMTSIRLLDCDDDITNLASDAMLLTDRAATEAHPDPELVAKTANAVARFAQAAHRDLWGDEVTNPWEPEYQAPE
jgi:hypothetical protein